MSMTREAQQFHEQYEAAPEAMRRAVDDAYDAATEVFKAAGLPTPNNDTAETLVADLFKYIVAKEPTNV